MKVDGLISGIVLSLLPVSELRGGIPVAIASGMDWFTAYTVCVIANFLIIFPVLFFLDYLHEHFLKISLYDKLFNLYVERVRKKVELKLQEQTWEYLVLFLFVAVPFPGTGAYTGCLIAWLFNLDRKKSILTIGLGVMAAGIIVTLVTTIASFGFLKIFIKNN